MPSSLQEGQRYGAYGGIRVFVLGGRMWCAGGGGGGLGGGARGEGRCYTSVTNRPKHTQTAFIS